MSIFAKALSKFQSKTTKNYLNVLRSSSFDLFSAIVLETPVDKGPLRNNWYAGIGLGSTQVNPDNDGGSAQQKTQEIEMVLNGVKASKDTFLTNNLPYAYPIEFDGHSGKAPQGMVRVNTRRWASIVSVNTKKVKSGN